MRILFTALLCLLLLGCSGEPAPTQPLSTEEPSSAQTAQALQQRYGSAVTVHLLTQRDVYSLTQTDSGLILLSGTGSTTVTLLRPDLSTAAQRELPFYTEDTGLSFFNPECRELLILDETLQPLHEITLPFELSGSAVVSPDQNTVYYCTSHAIHAWDLQTGIRRRIKELSYPSQSITAVHLEGRVLQCRVEKGNEVRHLFLDSATGSLLWEHTGEISLTTQGENWYATFPAGFRTERVFGHGNAIQALYPPEAAGETVFLPRRKAAVTITREEECTTLNLYDLEQGSRSASLTLDGVHTPKSITETEDHVLLLVYDPAGDCHVILSWDPLSRNLRDNGNYAEDYHTAENHDTAGLASCQNYARELSAKFGVDIRIGKDAASRQPWDYTFQPEHQYRVVREQLLTLERCLSRYPAEVLSQTAAHFQGLTFCLVRSIRGSSPASSLDIATGIQFLQDDHAYVVLAAGPYQEQSLYHELFHVMETHILSASGAMDHWNSLNPAGFSYDLDYTANARRNSGVYLQPGQRAFVDTYSMSFPREDRARIFEYAMLSGQEELFLEDILQQKLTALCRGIREAYGLEKWTQPLPWEQYLQ